jgi:hypothetical protein
LHIHCYFHSATGQLVIPAAAKTEAGFYLEQGPVEIVDIADALAVIHAAKRIWSHGHSVVPTPDRDSYTRTPPFKLRGVRTWSDVERQCSLWEICDTPDSTFKIEQWVSPPRQNGFVHDVATDEILPKGSLLSDAVLRLIARIRESPID